MTGGVISAAVAQMYRLYCVSEQIKVAGRGCSGTPEPTDSCQLTKSERKEEGLGHARKMPPQFPAPLI